MSADFVAATSYGFTVAVVIEKNSGVPFSQDLAVDYGGEMQIMDRDLNRRDGCAAAMVVSYIAVGIVQKWC